MLGGLYKVLIIDSASDDENVKNMKKLVYDLTDMDTAALQPIV